MQTLYTLFAQIKYDSLPKAQASPGQIDTIVNIVFSIAGGLALLFVIIGGLRYVISRGDPQSTAQAKNTILFALVGLIVTIMAYAIVRFVAGSIG